MSSLKTPCAACKTLRRKCINECVFAHYFPPDQPQRFESVHRVYGASNVAKILSDLPSAVERAEAVTSLVYEAEARLKDPVYGCVGSICILRHKLKRIQSEIESAKQELGTLIEPPFMGETCGDGEHELQDMLKNLEQHQEEDYQQQLMELWRFNTSSGSSDVQQPQPSSQP